MVCELCLNKIVTGRKRGKEGGKEGENKKKNKKENQTQTSNFSDFPK